MPRRYSDSAEHPLESLIGGGLAGFDFAQDFRDRRRARRAEDEDRAFQRGQRDRLLRRQAIEEAQALEAAGLEETPTTVPDPRLLAVRNLRQGVGAALAGREFSWTPPERSAFSQPEADPLRVRSGLPNATLAPPRTDQVVFGGLTSRVDREAGREADAALAVGQRMAPQLRTATGEPDVLGQTLVGQGRLDVPSEKLIEVDLGDRVAMLHPTTGELVRTFAKGTPPKVPGEVKPAGSTELTHAANALEMLPAVNNLEAIEARDPASVQQAAAYLKAQAVAGSLPVIGNTAAEITKSLRGKSLSPGAQEYIANFYNWMAAAFPEKAGKAVTLAELRLYGPLHEADIGESPQSFRVKQESRRQRVRGALTKAGRQATEEAAAFQRVTLPEWVFGGSPEDADAMRDLVTSGTAPSLDFEKWRTRGPAR